MGKIEIEILVCLFHIVSKAFEMPDFFSKAIPTVATIGIQINIRPLSMTVKITIMNIPSPLVG